MEKIIEMQKKRKEEKPVKMLIKGGMLFKVVNGDDDDDGKHKDNNNNPNEYDYDDNDITYNENMGNDNSADDDGYLTNSITGRHDD